MPQVDEKAIAKEKKAKQLEEQGGEVNIIDSTDLALDAEEIVNACA